MNFKDHLQRSLQDKKGKKVKTLLDKIRSLPCFPTDATIRRVIFLKGLMIDGQPIEDFEDLRRPAFHCEVKVGQQKFSI